MINYADLANRAYRTNRFIFTDFLTLAEVSELEASKKDFAGITYSYFGGYDEAERVIARFGNPNDTGYEEDFPIQCLRVEFLAPKFAKACSHRDYLGSLMGLGLERKCFGDIITDEKGAYIFVLQKNSEYVMNSLTSVGRNSIIIKESEFPNDYIRNRIEEKTIQVSSVRADGTISHVFNLSRSDATLLFREKKVAINGKICENNDRQLNEKDIVSLRGYGRFKVLSFGGLSKKGKQNIVVGIFR